MAAESNNGLLVSRTSDGKTGAKNPSKTRTGTPNPGTRMRPLEPWTPKTFYINSKEGLGGIATLSLTLNPNRPTLFKRVDRQIWSIPNFNVSIVLFNFL